MNAANSTTYTQPGLNPTQPGLNPTQLNPAPSLSLRLLRDPLSLLRARHDRRTERQLAAHCLLVIALGGALFGAAVGWYRGGLQAVAGGIKLPLVTLLTMALCGPAFVAIARTAGKPWRWRHALITMLVAGARSSLLLAALAPLVWLGVELGLGYHQVKLLAALAYGIAGLSALTLLSRSLADAPGRGWATLGLTIVMALVGGQSAWLLRPYLGAPEDREVPLLVNRREGGLPGAVWRSLRPDRRRRSEASEAASEPDPSRGEATEAAP